MAARDCRFFNGYKPCGKVDSLASDCTSACAHYDRPRSRVLLIHLGALGAVVRSTALLPGIRRKFPGCHITWVTEAPGDVLLREHPLVDQVIVADPDGIIGLGALEFDVTLVVDKSLKASGVLRATTSKRVFGFVTNPKTGGVEPATPAAEEAWKIGLSNQLKFHVNEKTETRLIHEALELGPWRRDLYSLHLNELEEKQVEERRSVWRDSAHTALIGINTGCASTIAYKKLSIKGHVLLLEKINRRLPTARLILLGGREDTLRNQTIAEMCRELGVQVIESETEAGLRDGMISVAACDLVVSGDSLGLHMALGFQKPTVAWFGPTCLQEIDLYNGIAVQTKAPCAPCWKRECSKSVMCYDQVDFDQMTTAVQTLLTLKREMQIKARLEIAPDL